MRGDLILAVLSEAMFKLCVFAGLAWLFVCFAQAWIKPVIEGRLTSVHVIHLVLSLSACVAVIVVSYRVSASVSAMTVVSLRLARWLAAIATAIVGHRRRTRLQVMIGIRGALFACDGLLPRVLILIGMSSGLGLIGLTFMLVERWL